jgi:hypothetical protein
VIIGSLQTNICVLYSHFTGKQRETQRGHETWKNYTVRKISRPAGAHPRNLSGSVWRLRKDRRQTWEKTGIRWAWCSGGDAQQPCPPPASLLYTVANKEAEQQFSGWRVFVFIRNRGTCGPYSLHLNILWQAAVLHFALAPFCSCQSQPADIAVLMSSSHRFLIVCSPQVKKNPQLLSPCRNLGHTVRKDSCCSLFHWLWLVFSWGFFKCPLLMVFSSQYLLGGKQCLQPWRGQCWPRVGQEETTDFTCYFTFR